MDNVSKAYDDWRRTHRHLDQSTHALINARYFPGTRELCCSCGEPTGRAGAGEDSLFNERDEGPFCEACWEIHRG